MNHFFVALIKLYQFTLSPFIGQNCRFTPTCSSYAIDCLQKHGVVTGSALTIKRLLSCHPWHEGGHDPVP